VDVALLEDAEAISSRWVADLNLSSLIEDRLDDSSALEGSVDLVAIGKVSREMARAAHAVLGQRIRRTIVISDVGDDGDTSKERVLIGEHPIPGRESSCGQRGHVVSCE